MTELNKADLLFKENIENILNNGSRRESGRAMWSDGTPANTWGVAQVVNRYNLLGGLVPNVTLRHSPIKNAIDEILWIFTKQSNDTSLLRSRIWDAWKFEDGTIGKSYGYQIAKPANGHDNQLDYVLHEIKNNPTSRRIMMSMFNIEDAGEKALQECAYETLYTVDGEFLDMTLIQRSSDFITANNWNLVQYSILGHLIAHFTGKKLRNFVHFIQDLHIYDRHIEIAKDMLNNKSYPNAKLDFSKLKGDDIYGVELDDIVVVYPKEYVDAKDASQIKKYKIEVAE